MKFLEVSEGFKVKIDAIEAIGQGTNDTSIIFTQYNSYNCSVPYNVISEILEKELSKNEVIEQKKLNIMKTQGNFAG